MPKRMQWRCAALLLVLMTAGSLVQANAATSFKFMQKEPELIRANLYQGNLHGIIYRLLKEQDFKSISSLLLQPSEAVDFRMMPGGSPGLGDTEP